MATNYTSIVGDIESITIDIQNENRDAKALQDAGNTRSRSAGVGVSR